MEVILDRDAFLKGLQMVQNIVDGAESIDASDRRVSFRVQGVRNSVSLTASSSLRLLALTTG
jgi:hypothetical protein